MSMSTVVSDVTALQEQRRALEQKLRNTESAAADLQTERERARAESFEALVRSTLSGGGASSESSTQLAEIEALLRQLDTTARATRVAIERIDVAIADVRATEKAEERIARRREARSVLARIITTIEQLDALSKNYSTLRGSDLPELPHVPPLYVADLGAWLAAAKRVAK
jgi:hypothetical protein